MNESVVGLFEQRVNLAGSRPALRARTDKGWESYSWRQWWECSERICAGLLKIGVEPGDRVAILARTRVEWAWADMAMMMARAISVPIYPSQMTSQSVEVLKRSGARALIVEDAQQLEGLLEVDAAFISGLHVIYLEAEVFAAQPDPKLRRRVAIDAMRHHWPKFQEQEATRPAVMSWSRLESVGRRALAEDLALVATRRKALSPSDVATIVYTSGTTGQVKGVVLTHQNLMAELEAITRKGLFHTDDVQLLILPLAHIFARVVFLSTISYGMEAAFAERSSSMLRDAREVEPTIIAVVPQMLSSIALGLRQRLEQMSPARARLYTGLFERALARVKHATDAAPARGVARALDVVMEHTLVTRTRGLFGGRLRVLICGGAALDLDTLELFHACGLPVLEGYGLTETSAALTLNLPQEMRLGSVGRALPGVDMTIDLDGEILARGEMVSSRYWGEPEPMLDARGWFRTGDLGRFDDQGYLYITGRKKELLVTAGGKNVAPALIEQRLESSDLVEHAVLFGDGRPYLVALLSLAQAPVRQWVKRAGLDSGMSWELLLAQDALKQALHEHVLACNAQGPSYESVRKFAFIPEPLSVESGMLTPTLKVRRAQIGQRWAELIDALYQRTM